MLRHTNKVDFFIVPEIVKKLSSIDQVRHQPGAFSPSMPDNDQDRPWYMHTDQEDNLLVFHGTRQVDLFTKKHGKIETFEATPDGLKHGDKIIYDKPCIFGWPTHVFHRVSSPEGSISTNFALRSDGFDLRTNFNIYDVNIENGDFRVVRDGYLDQDAI